MDLFNKNRKPKVPRANFNLSHEVKLTTDIGKLTPVLCEEVVPGDKWHISSEMMVRLMPLVSPVMHRMNVYIHYFYVPNRIIWEDWENFITGEEDLTLPTKTYTRNHVSVFANGRLADYLGLPTHMTSSDNITFTDLPFRAYWKIWNDYYRDQNLQDEMNVEALSGTWYLPQYRSWEKDYFTSALPFAQKGESTYVPAQNIDYLDPATWEVNSGVNSGDLKVDTSSNNHPYLNSPGFVGDVDLTIKNIDSVNIDINDLRTANRIQKFLEKNARAGTRYVEHLLSHFGVRSSDKRLQRPEYIGGGKAPIVISEVLNTSDTSNAVQGEMSGHGISVGKSNKATCYCEEHGYIMGILSIIPKTSYHQGLHKKWTRQINTDFYFPEFANLGEQEVKRKEVYLEDAVDDDNTFGYQSRYAEYKYLPSRIAGEFKDSLLFWSMSRAFGTNPQLNENFITTEAEGLELQNRIFAAGSERDSFVVQIYHNIIAARPMPYYAEPSL